MTPIAETKYTQADIQACIDLLEFLVRNKDEYVRLSDEQRIALITVAGQISRPDRDQIRLTRKTKARLKKQTIENHQRILRAETGIRAARTAPVFTAPGQITDTDRHSVRPVRHLLKSRACYVCKKEFTRLHFFYDSMCPACADFNYSKRFQTAPMHGQVALITGSRLKIGYQSALMMLRAGATVIATTRFPVDSARRYSKEKDFSQWHNRLHVYGLDLRHTPSVELFTDFVRQKYHRLDILINNASQTVRRPPGFYAHLIPGETTPYQTLPAPVQELLRPFEDCKNVLSQSAALLQNGASTEIGWSGTAAGIGISASARLSQIPYTHDRTLAPEKIFPAGSLDADLQQVDLREVNSWRLRLGEISTAELIELQLVNAIAPFVLCNKLAPMMKLENTGQKHIVNVSAMEGKFTRYVKTDRHPHTNMAKAALNMLTHTSAPDLAKHGIFMNAVDTGWVTDEDPAVHSTRKKEELDFQPPLDIVDGAARVCDPFFHGILTGSHIYGKFLKDYFPIDW